MGIEISGKNARPPHDAVEADKSQTTNTTSAKPQAGSGAKTGSSSTDQLQLSSQAAQLQALEAEIANLPVVDAKRVQDVQRTLATGQFQIRPAEVANNLLTFEAGLGRA